LAISDNRYRPKLNLVTYALAALTIILIITSFTGIDTFRSFWGNTERMSGVIAWFHFVAFAVILSSVLRTEREWRNFFGIAVIVSVLEFFYVLAQYFGATWVWLPHSQIGTIGNADLLGSYAIFSAFFALYLWHDNSKSEKSDFRYLWIIAFFLNIGTLYFAGSRGAMLGFGAGLFVYMLLSVWQNRQKLKIWAAIVFILILSYSILWLFRNTDFVQNSYQLSRITRISLQDTTVQQRFVEWGIAWEAFKARPIFGFGPNNYLYLHNAFLNPRVYILQETNFDRAHNAYLDYASMSGVLGLLGYLFLIGALFWAFCPPTGDLPKGEKMRLLPFASLIAAYAVQSFFVFDSPASYIALFLTIGFVSSQEISRRETISKQITNPKTLSPQVVAAISIFYFLFSIFLIWQISVKPAQANYKFVRAFNDPSIIPEEAFKLYREALASETLGSTEFRNQYINWLQRSLANFRPENRLEVLDFGIGELEKEIKDHPLVFSYLNLGQLYSYKARGVQDEAIKKELFVKAAGAYDKALELSPKRLEVFYSYLQLALETKDFGKGVEVMKRAVEAAPNYPKTWWYLGFAYVASGNDVEAIKNINKALIVWYRGVIIEENGQLKYDLDKVLKYPNYFAPKQEILGVVSPYIERKMWPELLLLYLSISAENSDNIEIHKSLALVYQNLGLTDKVQQELKIIETLSKTE
jgi:O-antigen ligase/tetratricopeptide (TPR) repeat protein